MINYLFSSVDKKNGFNSLQKEYLKKDIENNLRGTSIKDRVDYLNKITLNNDKNRFYIGD